MTLRFLISRMAQMLLVLIGVSFAVFALTRMSGDPVSLMVGPTATQADIDALRQSMGLDEPFLVQYAAFLGGILKGDRSEEHTSELQSRGHLVCRLLLEKKKK